MIKPIVNFNESRFKNPRECELGLMYRHCALCVHASRDGGDFPCMDCLCFPPSYPYFSPVTAPVIIICSGVSNAKEKE